VLNVTAGFPLDFDVYFPQVAKGTFGTQLIETLFVISNPGPQTANITLRSFGIDLPEPRSFQVEAGKTREINLRGEAAQVGWVRLTSDIVVAAAAHLSIRSAQDPNKIFSEVAVLGQPLISKAVVPVFLKAPISDNTGIAMAYFQDGFLKFTLYDPEGRQIATRTEQRGFNLGRPSSDHAAMFITELFPNIPSDLTTGSLVVEHVSPKDIAIAFAITALYTRGDTVTAAAVTGIDDPRSYVVLFKSEANVSDQATQLAAQYGFRVDRITLFNAAVGLMTHEVARAVARDPRVKQVLSNNAVLLSF
jgi:hypothetical protein